jgi:signal transduction histidine kinase
MVAGEERQMEPSPSVAVPAVNESDKVKVLLVDDQPAKLLTYEVTLAGIGETLIKASSALEAFECLLKHDIALILIDVCMPDLDGFELARMIREHPRFQRTGIIFVSAVMTADLDQLRGYELGAFDYVTVPVVPEVLRAKVKVFVDLHRKTRQLERLNAELEQRILERSAALRRMNEQLERRIEERTCEREKALAQLYESHKLDTIGHLTGEVAHDFNNLLMAVLGSLTLLQKRMPENPECGRLLHIAVQGGQRGATLARRLLAFSRRQELKPESVDIGELVCGMEDLLMRALGFDIELKCQFPSTLPPVLVDFNQLEVALLNIALNARDAMPGGGRLLISALEDTVGSGAADCSLPPGDYVRLRVADTGVGMDEVTRAKAAEPFFTTKCPGMGAGLGLSVAQGIAAQSKGMLRINSAPNLGTTVELWLPQSNTCPVSVGREVENPRAGPGISAL